MIEVINLTKTYGKKDAVSNISFTVNSGEILGFLGPNGAGKTTTMNIISGYICATEGRVLIDGHDVLTDSNYCRSKIGYLPEQPPLYMNMTVLEYLGFVYDIKNVSKNKNIKINKKDYIAKILELVKITDVSKRVIKNLSKGYKQRVGIAQCLIGDPEILILDEPTVGLDPKQILEIRNVIRELGKNRTVILSSHILSEISEICERVIIINNGKLLAEDTPKKLSEKIENRNKFEARIEGEKNAVDSALNEISGIHSFKFTGVYEEGTCDYLIESTKDYDIRKNLFKILSNKNLGLLMLNPVSMSLEDIFLELTENNIALLDDGKENKGDEI